MLEWQRVKLACCTLAKFIVTKFFSVRFFGIFSKFCFVLFLYFDHFTKVIFIHSVLPICLLKAFVLKMNKKQKKAMAEEKPKFFSFRNIVLDMILAILFVIILLSFLPRVY